MSRSNQELTKFTDSDKPVIKKSEDLDQLINKTSWNKFKVIK